MKALKYFEKSLTVYHLTRYNIPEALDLQHHLHENLISRKYVSTIQPIDRRFKYRKAKPCRPWQPNEIPGVWVYGGLLWSRIDTDGGLLS